MKGCLLTILGFIALCTLIGFCVPADNSTSHSNKASNNSGPAMTGDVRRIGSIANKNLLPCFPQQSGLDAMEKALAASDNEGYQESILSAVGLHKGQRVRVIDRGGMLGMRVKLRVLNGTDEGAGCWVEGDLEGLFQ